MIRSSELGCLTLVSVTNCVVIQPEGQGEFQLSIINFQFLTALSISRLLANPGNLVISRPLAFNARFTSPLQQ